MSKIMAGFGEWSLLLCEALGVDPAMTHRITINVCPNEAVTATIETYISKDNHNLIEVIKSARWVEDESPKEIINMKDEFVHYSNQNQEKDE
jgi:hypothetical protein